MLNFRNFPPYPCRNACRRSLAALALAAASALLPLTAHADNLQDAQRLLKQGQQGQALEQVEKYLSGKPKDAQGRFLKGLILTEMGKTSDAITVFSKLTEDYPELPEPYNNLAVIYAQQKHYEKAKQALEMAIRTHPSYATAHENLGDIYARLASQAYDKALQLDKGNASAQSKLSLIREIMSTSARTGTRPAARPTVAEPKQPAAKPVEPTPTIVAAVTPAPAPVTQPAPSAPAAQTPTPATTAAKPVIEAKPAGNAVAEIGKSVEAWAAAWSKKDVKSYLAFYAKDFRTPGGEPRTKWEAERKRRIDKPAAIKVSIENLRVDSEDADRATVKFRQHYRSGSFKTSANKILVLVKRDGKWQIQQEKVGN